MRLSGGMRKQLGHTFGKKTGRSPEKICAKSFDQGMRKQLGHTFGKILGMSQQFACPEIEQKGRPQQKKYAKSCEERSIFTCPRIAFLRRYNGTIESIMMDLIGASYDKERTR
jgi:hypothetical protein